MYHIRFKSVGLVTFSLSTEIFGRAAWYKMNIKLMLIPIMIPYSKGSARQATNVASPGIKSLSETKMRLFPIFF